MNLCSDYLNDVFSHIYVEEAILGDTFVQEILAKFKNSRVIAIKHYKDVFARRVQNSSLQRASQKLILARKEGELIYKGAPVCQSFGNEHFYYTSCVMNCIYDCEYCYLKGMYPSGNLVVFVNTEDIFKEVESLLGKHPVYLCVSYDTDIMALEGILGYTARWADFAQRMRSGGYDLTIEVRTKSANRALLESLPVTDGVVYAFTLSPVSVVKMHEKKTPYLWQRLEAAAAAVQKGHRIRLCFDPMIYCRDWETQYGEMLDMVFDMIDMDRIMDVSVGSFRISQEYLKTMRRSEPASQIAQFPYEVSNGYYHYPDELLNRMENFVTDKLEQKLPHDKIFRWK